MTTDAGPRTIGSLSLSAAGQTHAGKVRELNEDSFVVSHGVYVVADGMGGHEAGEVASRIAADVFAQAATDVPLAIDAVARLVADANRAIRDHAASVGSSGMGTTVVGGVVTQNGDDATLLVFNVGDSRCYALVDGVLRQITTDHSHVQELVAAGQIAASDARTHPMRNVVTRALGTDEAVVADYAVVDDAPVRVLLCSDGLSGEISDASIAALLTAAPDARSAADALVDAVLDGPARDNVTVVVLDLERATPAADLEDTQPRAAGVEITGPPPRAADSEPPRSSADHGTATDLIDVVPGADRTPVPAPVHPPSELIDQVGS